MIIRSNQTIRRAGSIVGLIAAAAIGWSFGDRSLNSEQRETPSAIETLGRPGQRPNRPAARDNIPAAARARVAALRAIRSPEDRMRATIHFANTLPVSEIEGWLNGRWFDLGEGYDLTLFNKILKQRWKEEDPEGHLRWVLKDSPGNAGPLLAEMAKTDPARMLEFFQENPNPSLALQTFSELAKTHPAIALDGLRSIIDSGINQHGNEPYYASRVIRELGKSAPDSLRAALASLPLSLQNTAEAALISPKLSENFATAVRELWDRPDGWKIFQEAVGQDHKLGAGLIAELTHLPPGWASQVASNIYYFIDDQNATEWFSKDLKSLGFSDTESRRIQTQAMSRIATTQPEKALSLLNQSELNNDDRRNVIGNMFGNLRDATKAEALIASLTTEEDQAWARRHLQTAEISVSAEKVEKPEDWLKKAVSVDAKDNARYELLAVLRNWDQDKIQAFSKEFRSLGTAEKQKVAQILAANNGHTIDPALQGEAIKHLVVNPPPPPPNESGESSATISNQQAIRHTSDHAVRWAATDPAAASSWVQSLPNGEEKIWAQKNLAVNWAEFDPQAAEQWIRSLPSTTRAEVEEFVKTRPRY